jgi:hypothetical protein
MTPNHAHLNALDVFVTRRFYQQHFDFCRIRDDGDDVFFATKKISYEARSNADRRRVSNLISFWFFVSIADNRIEMCSRMMSRRTHVARVLRVKFLSFTSFVVADPNDGKIEMS